MFQESKTSNYYNFPPVENSIDFLNVIKDIATLLFTIYDDIPSSFYFFKDNKYEVRFSNESDLLELFRVRLPDLYNSFLYSLNIMNKSSVESFIEQLFIDKIISFNRNLQNKKIISNSNYFNIHNMRFIDRNLYYSLFKMNIDIQSNTMFSKIMHQINKVINILKKVPNEDSKNKVIKIINSLNGRQGEFYFEEQFHFSWALLIISEGNSYWLNELEGIISKKTYEYPINTLVLSVFLDDVNILKFYLNKSQNNDIIIDNPLLEIKKIQSDYVNYLIADEQNVSLLSFCVLLDSIKTFNYLLDKSDINLVSGKNKETALFFACKHLRIDFIKKLVDSNCELNIENINANIAAELLPLNKEADEIFTYLENKRKAS